MGLTIGLKSAAPRTPKRTASESLATEMFRRPLYQLKLESRIWCWKRQSWYVREIMLREGSVNRTLLKEGMVKRPMLINTEVV